jgi:hypothetical protein
MKQTRTLLHWLTACGVAMATIANATAATAKQRNAEVVRIKGSARYSTGNNVWQPLKVGTILGAGSIVQTASDSVVDIVFGAKLAPAPHPTSAGYPATGDHVSYNPIQQRDVVRLQPDTVMAIDKVTSVQTGADIVTETQLDLRKGSLIGSVNKLSAASTFEIKIPNGVAGIRGTFFTISATGGISVWEGAVSIAVNTPDGPKVVTVNPGFSFDVNTVKTSELPPGSKPEGRPHYFPDPQVYLGEPKSYISSTVGTP